MIQFCIFLHLFRDINDGNIITFIIVVDICFHFEKVDDSFEFIFFSDWKLNADCIFTKSCLDLFYCSVEVCT